MHSQFRLLGSRRFLPLFVTQFLGAFNDNVLRNSLILLVLYVFAADREGGGQILVAASAGIFVLPFFLLSNRDTAGDPAQAVTVTVDISYQACTGSECYLPERLNLDLELTEEPNPGYEAADLGALAPLVMRRIVEGPKTEAELLDLVNAALAGVEVTEAEVTSTLAVLEGRGLVAVGEPGRWSAAG